MILTRLYAAFVTLDAMLVEINPLILTTDGRVIALDAKVTIDDNALYRHPDVAALQESVHGRPAGADGPARRASPTSSSTATSASWATARGS